MTAEIQTFKFNNATMRTLTDENGEPWFVAKDVCGILEVSNPSDALKRLDDDERSRFNLGRQGETNIINEAGLYSLVLGSRKPEAHEFKRWVTHEVLPQIRRTGGYIPTSESDSDEAIMAKALLIAQKTIERNARQLRAKDRQIMELEPKAKALDDFTNVPDTLLIRDAAKLLSNAGHLAMVESRSHGRHKNGNTFAFAPTVKITRKGLALLHRRLGETLLCETLETTTR